MLEGRLREVRRGRCGKGSMLLGCRECGSLAFLLRGLFYRVIPFDFFGLAILGMVKRILFSFLWTSG